VDVAAVVDGDGAFPIEAGVEAEVTETDSDDGVLFKV